MAILSGCSTKSYKTCPATLNLPEMPLAGEKVAYELKHICTDNKCFYLNDWFNRLEKFRQDYTANLSKE